MARSKFWYFATCRYDESYPPEVIMRLKRKTPLEAIERWLDGLHWDETDALYLVRSNIVLWEIPVPPEVLDELQNKA